MDTVIPVYSGDKLVGTFDFRKTTYVADLGTPIEVVNEEGCGSWQELRASPTGRFFLADRTWDEVMGVQYPGARLLSREEAVRWLSDNHLIPEEPFATELGLVDLTEDVSDPDAEDDPPAITATVVRVSGPDRLPPAPPPPALPAHVEDDGYDTFHAAAPPCRLPLRPDTPAPPEPAAPAAQLTDVEAECVEALRLIGRPADGQTLAVKAGRGKQATLKTANRLKAKGYFGHTPNVGYWLTEWPPERRVSNG